MYFVEINTTKGSVDALVNDRDLRVINKAIHYATEAGLSFLEIPQIVSYSEVNSKKVNIFLNMEHFVCMVISK